MNFVFFGFHRLSQQKEKCIICYVSSSRNFLIQLGRVEAKSCNHWAKKIQAVVTFWSLGMFPDGLTCQANVPKAKLLRIVLLLTKPCRDMIAAKFAKAETLSCKNVIFLEIRLVSPQFLKLKQRFSAVWCAGGKAPEIRTKALQDCSVLVIYCLESLQTGCLFRYLLVFLEFFDVS